VAGEIVVGLDVGTTKICTIVAEATPDGDADVIGFGNVPCTGLRKGLVVDMDATVDAIRASVDAASRMCKVELHSVTVGVTGQHMASLNTRGSVVVGGQGGEITEEDRQRVLAEAKQLVQPPDRQILHLIPRQFIVDGQGGIHEPVGMSGTRLEVEAHVITASRSFVDNVLKCVRRAGLELDGDDDSVVLESIATAEAVLTEEDRRMGVLLADIGGGTTDVAVFLNGAIYHSAVIPVGGEHVTNDISIGLRLPYSEANRAKLEYGLATVAQARDDETITVTQVGAERPVELPRRLLGEIIEPRMTELFVRGVKAEMEACGREGLLPGGIILTGGASLLPGVVELASKVLDMPARLGLPRCEGGISEVLSGPQFATAVGLAKIAARRHAGVEADAPDGGLLSSFGRSVAGLFRALFGPRRAPRRRRPK
jgi:cell division protein FtsA